MFGKLFSRRAKTAAQVDLVGLQKAIVRSVVDDRTELYDGKWEDRDWVYLAVNHELLIEDGRRSSTQAKVLAHKGDGALEDLSFRLSPGSKAAILALRDAMVGMGQAPWTILDLKVDRSGKYEVSFSYEPPPRLNGDLLHNPNKDLLERYRAQNS